MTWRAPAALGVLLVLSLGLRVWARGGALIGYELVLPAQGLAAISTQPWGTVLRDGWGAWRSPVLSAPPSILLSVVPGALTALVPGRGWGIACNLLLTVGAFALLLRATWWSTGGATVLFASLLTSNPMLSMAIWGYPRITGIVAHCMALWIILRLRRSPWVTLGATIALLVLVPQLYDSGKLVVATFAVAVVTVRGARWQSRVLWTLFAVVLGGAVLWVFPSQPVGWFLRFGNEPFTRTWRWATALPLELWQREQVLPMLGALALIGLQGERLFLAALWFAHLAWGMYQAASPSLGAAGYRLLPWECYATAILVLRARSRGLPWGIGVAMSAAIALQLWRLAAFVQAPPMSGEANRYTIPEPPMAAGWDLAKPPVFRWEAAMLADLRAGHRLWVLYNFHCYDENYAAPLGVPEHLYLALGHERFVDSVVMFSDTPCRHDCLPFHPMKDLPAFVAGASGEWVVWDPQDCSAPEVVLQREMLASMPTREWSAVDEARRGLVNLKGP
jgi:hypothetical protein